MIYRDGDGLEGRAAERLRVRTGLNRGDQQKASPFVFQEKMQVCIGARRTSALVFLSINDVAEASTWSAVPTVLKAGF